jgi:hypothetical protein
MWIPKMDKPTAGSTTKGCTTSMIEVGQNVGGLVPVSQDARCIGAMSVTPEGRSTTQKKITCGTSQKQAVGFVHK